MRVTIRLWIIAAGLFGGLLLARLSKAEDCAKMDHGACMRSTACTLDGGGKTDAAYHCRPRVPPCETGFSNADASARKSECESRPGCKVTGGCYCPCTDPHHASYQRCMCRCGGGTPMDCREQSGEAAGVGSPPPSGLAGKQPAKERDSSAGF